MKKEHYLAINSFIVAVTMTFASESDQSVAEKSDAEGHFYRKIGADCMKCFVLAHHELQLKKQNQDLTYKLSENKRNLTLF
jgi:hypothetical protein